MSMNSPQSPVLVEQASPPPQTHDTHISTSQIPLVSNLLNELASTGLNPTGEAASQQQQIEIMDNDVEVVQVTPLVQDNMGQVQAVPVEPSHGDESGGAPVGTVTEPPTSQADTNVNSEADPLSAVDAEVPSSGAVTADTTVDATEQPTPTDHGETSTEAPPVDSAAGPPQDAQTSENPQSPANPSDEIPDWVKYEEDTTTPDEEEMKEIEGSEYDKLSALDIAAMEDQFYTDLEDPEQRPVKKLRLSWVIKGVRGTKERPNFARVMNSPGACVDGLYWSIKFYPRGDNCSSLSAFVRCSREPPPVDEEYPESDFSFFEGSPETDFSSNIEPKVKMTVLAKDGPKPEPKLEKGEQPESDDLKKQTDNVEPEDTPSESTPASQEATATPVEKEEVRELPNWRVSAQLGMAIYNPVEPRTGHMQSDGHQFSRYCDDWGWVNFVGPWEDIHRRKRGQRQALLRNDTLAIDAYIRIYDDPTQALWWHESKDENQWPSKELAGYLPMGTPDLYHSPAVAGITAWLLLAPFREILQSADGGRWRTDTKSAPKPLICHSQLVLDQMRNQSSNCYVNLYKIVQELLEVDERWNDVKSFWEVFRRSLELEMADEPEFIRKLSSMFDAAGSTWKMPSLPVPDTTSVQQGLNEFFGEARFRGSLPDFMPVMLNRSDFDRKAREWQLKNDRVRLDDELDLSKWCTDSDSKYTLYGFLVHVGTRNSGKFYSVLRPGGMNTKWLAFEDGNGNKVFSYSKKRIQEFEGLEGEELTKFPSGQTRENAYMAMYVRTSSFKSYLHDSLEPYKVPTWLKPWLSDTGDDDDDDQIQQEMAQQLVSDRKSQDENGIPIELYLDECAEGCEDMLRLHDIRSFFVTKDLYRQVIVATDKTFKDLRVAIAQKFEVKDPTDVQMWEIHYQGMGNFSRAILEPIRYRRKIVREAFAGRTFRLWVSVRQPVGEHVSYKHLLHLLDDLNLDKKSTQDDQVKEIADTEPPAAATNESTSEQESTPIAEVPPMLGESDVAGPDAVQASIQAAVEADIERIGNNQDRSENSVAETIAPTSTEQSESSEGEDGVMTPTSSIRSDSLSPETNASNHNEPSLSETPQAVEDDEATRAVVHGHLPDAAQHAELLTDSSTTEDSVANTGENDVAQASENGVIGNDAQQSESDEEDEEDQEDEQDERLATSAERESQNRTPTQPQSPRGYSTIQEFDSDRQTFIVRRPFHPELDMEIGVAIRKELNYDSERQFKVWRWQGSSAIELIPSNTTFVSAGLTGAFRLIVGDNLSEVQMSELKAAGKFGQPQQLVEYLDMTKRKHPYLSLTSADAVELADYGNDYYRGPLSRGRPHGEQGYLITSTGHTYSGPFVAGEKSGSQGRMTYQNGDTYVGEWYNDERHGQGEYVEKRTGNRYVGGYDKGKRWGEGITYWQVADQQAGMCQICYEEEIDALFYDCGHVCACVNCAKQCPTCPICRRSVRQVVKMYRV